MSRAITVIEQEIRALSASDKEELLGILLEELDDPSDGDVEPAWHEEVQRRTREIDSGAVRCIPADEVFARIDDKIKK